MTISWLNTPLQDRFEDLVDDASQFTDLVMAKHPGVPIIVAGHSLGGLVAVLLLARRQKDFAGLVLQSAAIDVEWTPLLKFQAVVGDCIATCCPFSKIVPAVRPQDMSEDPKVVQVRISRWSRYGSQGGPGTDHSRVRRRAWLIPGVEVGVRARRDSL